MKKRGNGSRKNYKMSMGVGASRQSNIPVMTSQGGSGNNATLHQMNNGSGVNGVSGVNGGMANETRGIFTGGAFKATGFGLFSEFFNRMSNSLNSLNNSKFFAGLVMLMLNIGSRYYTISLSKTQEDYLRYNLAREFVIFAMAWVGTRDVVISFLITAAFVILADYLFNEESKVCMIPNQVLQKQKLMRTRVETNNHERITPDKERSALEILEKAQKQKEMENQVSFVNILRQYQHNVD